LPVAVPLTTRFCRPLVTGRAKSASASAGSGLIGVKPNPLSVTERKSASCSRSLIELMVELRKPEPAENMKVSVKEPVLMLLWPKTPLMPSNEKNVAARAGVPASAANASVAIPAFLSDYSNSMSLKFMMGSCLSKLLLEMQARVLKLRCIRKIALSILSAHIDGYGERAVDAFYVATADGQKLTDTRRANAIRARLLDVLEASETPAQRLPRARASAAR